VSLEEARRLIHAVAVATVCTLVLGWVGHSPVPRGWLAGLCGSALLLTSAGRLVARRVIRRLQKKGWLRSRVLVVGVNEESLRIERTMRRQHRHSSEVVGFVTTGAGLPVRTDVPVIGTVADLPDAVRTARADAVILAATALDPGALPELYAVLQRLGVDVRVSAGLPDVAASRVSVEPLDGLAMLAVRPNQLASQEKALKRIVDVIGSLMLLVAVAPVMALVALVVRLTSPGPVIFRQVRVGEGGEPFTIYKFRTMVNGAEDQREAVIDLNEADGPLFKILRDPRVTGAGQLLRRLALDELPQLWNVLRGDMSLVGPRPPLPDETERYTEWVRGRLRVKPGMTGLWQISGRHELSFADYVRYDLFYIDNWSLLMDAVIVLRTMPVLLSRRGAA
jgi:exopolysaccharide biosynthesis polyprenyl glycosylphosphotransferase